MGMFNYVFVDCPECNSQVEFQSKSGSCKLERFHISNLPVDEIEGVLGEIETCENCGFIVQVQESGYEKLRLDFSHLVK